MAADPEDSGDVQPSPTPIPQTSDTQTHGLLGTLSNIVTNLGNSVADGFTNAYDQMADIFGTVGDFLRDFFTGLGDKITELFAPEDNFWDNYTNAVMEVSRTKFGMFHELEDMIGEFWESFEASDRVQYVTFPEVTIPLPQGNSFTFGGYRVKVVPDGFQGIADTLKVLVSIVCTAMYVNAMIKRLYELFGVNASDIEIHT